ncbi:MAG TPA: ABC transporter permease [Actinomycetota bacterium]
MRTSRASAIAGRILKQFRHDKRTVGLIVIVPIVVMALIGYLIGDPGKEPLPVAVVNLDVGAQTVSIGSRIADAIGAEDAVAVRTVSSAPRAESLVRSGEVVSAVVLPADLTELVLRGGSAAVRVLVTGIDPGVQGPVLAAVRTAVTSLAGNQGPGGAVLEPPLAIAVVPLEASRGLSTLDYNAPALIAVFAFFFTFLLTSVGFLRERSSGTLERLMASPVTRLEVLTGYLLGFIGFAMIQSLIILGYAVWILNVPVEGSIWLVLLVIVILVMGSVNLGIALSFYARNELQVVQFIPLVLLPQVFLGGLFWPVQTLWPPLRYLSQVFPLTHATVALRTVMVGGGGSGDVAGRLLALVALSAAMLAIGVLALRKSRA